MSNYKSYKRIQNTSQTDIVASFNMTLKSCVLHVNHQKTCHIIKLSFPHKQLKNIKNEIFKILMEVADVGGQDNLWLAYYTEGGDMKG